MRKLLTGAALAAVFATPAFAADAVMSPEPAPAPVVTQPAGFDWTGAYVGGQLGYAFSNQDPGGSDDDSFIGGFHAGYDYDFGNFVVGVEGQYDFLDSDFGTGYGIDTMTTGKLRVGADLGRTLLYGTGGLSYVHGDSSPDDYGYVVGAGVDFAATDHIIVGAEYNYHDFSDVSNTGVDLDSQTFQARVGYKF